MLDWTLAGKFRQVRQRCITFYLYGGLFRTKSKLSRKQVLFVSFGFRAENNLIFDDDFSALLSKLHSESVQLFCDLLWTNSFVSFSRSEQDFVGVLEWNFWQFCQNCILLLKHQFEEKPTYQKNSISYPLGLGEEIILTTDNLGSALLTWLRFVFVEHNFDTFSSNFIFSDQLRCLRMNFFLV